MAWGAPQIRIAAASQALGAPKGVQKAPKANLPRPQKAPARQMPQANPHPNHPGQNQHAHAGPAPNPESLSLLDLNPQQIARRGTRMAQQQLKAELAPLQNQATELSGSEAAAQARYKALSEAQTQNLSALSQSSEAQAKTAENRAADLALKTGKSVETAGQAEAGQLGGYVSPELKAQMLAAGQRASETSGAAQSFAASAGQNEVSFLNNLRAAAAAKATEGAKQLAAPYAKSLSENSAKQREATARLAPNAAKYSEDLEQKQFNDTSVRNKQALEAGYKGAQITLGQRNAASKERDISSKAQLGNRKLGLEGQKLSLTREIASKKAEIESGKLSETERYHRAQEVVQKQKASGKAPSPAAGRKYMGALDSAAGYAARWKNEGKTQAEIRSKLQSGEETGVGGEEPGHGFSPDQVAAAMNLAWYGRLSKSDQKVAESYGLSKAIRPAWFK